METLKPFLTISILFISSIPLICNAYHFERLNLTMNVSGPESLAFDCEGGGPYTGVSDGRILKWEGPQSGWSEFTVYPNRRRDICDGSNDPELEHICGRPLGLEFNKVTCELYIADAYFGLFVVGCNGGVAKLLVSSAEGVPFMFTNSLDIDTTNEVIYFTDSSSRLPRREYMEVALSGDNTGRFMKYDLQSKEVVVLLRDLQFPNGVALNKDRSYILISETTTSKVYRYWLKGSKANTSEVLTILPSNTDNIKMNSKGDFWIGLNNGTGGIGIRAARIDGDGQILEILDGSNSGRYLEYVSEVKEHEGTLWIGSVILNYLKFSKKM